jgi:hypothetical protein
MPEALNRQQSLHSAAGGQKMKHSNRPLSLPEPSEPGTACPFGWRCQSATDAPGGHRGEHCPETGYIQARRQGIYLAACIVDEVAALHPRSPDAVIDEIRRRICELVRHELKTAPSQRRRPR